MNVVIEIKPDRKLVWKFKLLDGLVGIGFGTGFVSPIQFLLFQNAYQNHLDELIKNVLLLWVIMFACSAFVFVLARLIQAKLKPEIFDILSVTISDKEIAGFSSAHAFTPKRAIFALSDIDVDKTSSKQTKLPFVKQLWQENRKYIWSKDGQKIVIEKSLFSDEQIKILSEKTGCTI
jgi:hypothetical protein